jgi:carboxyl-terminal processing protease
MRETESNSSSPGTTQQPVTEHRPGQKKVRERILWISLTTVLISLLIILSFAPRVMAQGQEKSTRDYLNMFNWVFQFVQKHYADEDKADPQKLIEGAMKGMIEALDDPHSAYLSMDEMRRLRDDTQGEFGGVGIYILKTDKGVEVARPIDGTPAKRAGIATGDVIIAVEGESIKDFSIDEVVKRLRGKAGAPVTMTVLRGSNYTFDITIVREMIEVPTVRQAMISDDIAYLYILKFTPMTLDRVEDAIDYFKDEGYASLILDLRSNPGGLLSSVVNVSDLFLDKGQVIVSTRSRIRAENRVFRAGKSPLVNEDINMIVLIDKYSASAAEILTGALKDTERAQVMGETSYGKGSVQQIINVDGGGFRLTTSKYYTPSGASIDTVGIIPDKEIEREEFSQEEIESYQKLLELNAVRQFLKEKPEPSEADIEAFVQSLRTQGIVLRRERIEKDIRDEWNRIHNIETVYDLEYDTVLREAVNSLN